jgi:hypothetical protein
MGEENSKYIMKDTITGKEVYFYVVQSVGYSFKNSIIRYESVGKDGGHIEQTGKFIKEVPLTLQLIGNLDDNFAFIKKLEKQYNPVTVFTNIDNANLFGTYVIEDVSTNITDGADSLIVSINFVEYKRAFTFRRNLTVPANKSLSEMLNYIKNQNLVDLAEEQ